ncbi:annexin A13-like [Lytechinus pictus]|uniref:annexin A13-like n=1 Tax=Lytechinus pictus TaxID=7653 RepID=UPI00240D9C9A|nr:annexin A13-like [Lytechinus pictus]
MADEVAEYIIKYRLARAALGLELLGCILEWEDFDAEADAVALDDAIRGAGTDEDAIIEILANRTNEQRQMIAFKYRACFGKDLKEELRDEVRGNLEKTVEALMDSPPMYDAKTLRAAMKGLGTDEDTIIEIMCTRVNGEIEAIKMAYQIEFDRDLAEDLESETSGNFKYLMQCICAGGRDESGEEVDEDKAVEDAQELFDAGEDRWGTDENVFNRILATRSFPQLRATFLAYNGIAGCDIEDSIRDECMGDLQDGYLAIVSRAREVGQYFAERLYDSMKGAGTDEDKLIRIVISRSEIDLKRIKIAFFAKYGQTLHAFIEDDCAGDFKKMLLAILHGENDEE